MAEQLGARRNRNAAGIRELSRFVLTGMVSTIANLFTVWASRHVLVYSVALLAGISTGFAVSFLLTKLFAFQSRQWRTASGEAARFTLVYGVGVTLYWLMSMMFGLQILPRFMPARLAEMLGVVAGAGLMTITSYLGHRFYTYRRTAYIG